MAVVFSNRRDGLESHVEADLFAVCDTALDAAGVVAQELRGAVIIDNYFVIGFGPFHGGHGEAVAVFKAFDSRDAEHRLGQAGLELVEHRLAETGRQSLDAAVDNAAHRVAIGSALLQQGFNLGRIRLAADAFHFGFNMNLMLCEKLFGDGAGNHHRCGGPCGCSASSPPVADAVFRLIGVVGMRGTEMVF